LKKEISLLPTGSALQLHKLWFIGEKWILNTNYFR